MQVPFKTALLGRHNVYNILAAVGILLALKFKLSDILVALKSFESVPGRLERVASDIYVDYAHTPDGLTQVLKTLRECSYKNIICVFGCGGDRDKGKRPIMGRIAGDMADYSIITSDNPRSEAPQKIINEVKNGFSKNNFSLCVDRKKALIQAIKIKNKYSGSCLLVAGKGHEDYQIIGDKKIPYSDQKVIREVLRHAHR
jgi:UDP-N-acetylmuramoyl-L-alanyl-D-glutamate--2,6-diaminopimelate ligase